VIGTVVLAVTVMVVLLTMVMVLAVMLATVVMAGRIVGSVVCKGDAGAADSRNGDDCRGCGDSLQHFLPPVGRAIAWV
jgi:hypothetical protein